MLTAAPASFRITPRGYTLHIPYQGIIKPDIAMQPIDWTIALTGVAVIAAFYWYFFRAGHPPVGAAPAGTVNIVVRGGYTPADIRVRAGQPLKLVLDRRDTSSCSEEIVFPD